MNICTTETCELATDDICNEWRVARKGAIESSVARSKRAKPAPTLIDSICNVIGVCDNNSHR